MNTEEINNEIDSETETEEITVKSPSQLRRHARRVQKDVIIDLDAKSCELPDITPGTMTISQISAGFEDLTEFENGGVTSMDGKLIIRPTYQRQYLHKPGDRWTQNLIRSILGNRPINTIYLGRCSCDFKDVIDGQQRIISICYFVHGGFPVFVRRNGHLMKLFFNQLSKEEQRKILNYELNIAWCDGTESQKKAWFNTINEESLILNAQEIRNASYASEFTEKLKKNFTNVRCFSNIKDSRYYAPNYHGGMKIDRQDYLEFALDLMSYKYCMDNGMSNYVKYYDDRIDIYMDYAKDYLDEADKVIEYYKGFCDWFYDIFMRGKALSSFQSLSRVDWARIYYTYGESSKTWPEERKIKASEDLRNLILRNYRAFTFCGGVYEWILRGEKDSEFNQYFALRGFSKRDHEELYEEQGGIDPIDGLHYELKDMHMHHIVTWRKGGISVKSNGVLMSIENHRKFHDGQLNLDVPSLIRMKNKLIEDTMLKKVK